MSGDSFIQRSHPARVHRLHGRSQGQSGSSGIAVTGTSASTTRRRSDSDVLTNTIKGFWSLFKNRLRGVDHLVGTKKLQSYADEYAFRYNQRDDEQAMFVTVMNSVKGVWTGRYGDYAPIA
jgi:hypothetical protein